MTLLAISTIAASIACFLAMAWLLARPLPQESLPNRGEVPNRPPAEHALHFSQLRHPLAGTDAPFVKRYTSPQIEKHWRDNRQQVLESFLRALGDDFARLAQLVAMTNAMLPQEVAQQRTVPLSLLLQFRTNYRLASLLLRMRSPAFTPHYQACRTPRKSLRPNGSTHGTAHAPSGGTSRWTPGPRQFPRHTQYPPAPA